MIFMGRLAAIFMLASVAGCASVISGTSQTLTLDTIPSGADCSLTRKGLVIGRVNPTPGAVYVQRTHDDITVSCTKEGYQTGSFLNKSGLEAATFGNIILGGLVGVFIDAASGANNKYDEKVRIVLAETDATKAVTAPPAGAMSSSVEFHCPSSGTTIKASGGRLFRFTDENGLRCGYTDETGDRHERYALVADAIGRIKKKDLDGLWPLKVGKTVEFSVFDATPRATADRPVVRNYQETFTVARQQRITVAAGTFDTFVVEWREKGSTPTNRTEALATLWYAPQVGYFVKSSVQVLDADPNDPYATSAYDGLKYEATEIAMPNGQRLPTAMSEPALQTTPAASDAPQAGPATTSEERLKTLQQLRDQNLITPEEYNARRKMILNEL
jgi:hypothetical protein